MGQWEQGGGPVKARDVIGGLAGLKPGGTLNDSTLELISKAPLAATFTNADMNLTSVQGKTKPTH